LQKLTINAIMFDMIKTKIKTASLDDEPEIFGQYASDWAFDPDKIDKEDSTGTLEARGDGNTGFHQGGILFDHESRNIADEATGATFIRQGAEDELEAVGLSIGDLAAKELKRRDPAEEWLRAHDPNYQERRWQ
jgi:hypothetical protein